MKEEHAQHHTEQSSDKMTANNLPEEISEMAAREKSIRHGSAASLHRWWARRPNVLARVGVYLALTETQNPDQTFLAMLGEVSPSEAILRLAKSNLRENQWRWAWREKRHDLDEGVADSDEQFSPETPRMLDPFAGGGSIPSEAARLGCEAYASDLNPVAYHILRATLQYPPAYSAPDEKIGGSAPKETWAGLKEELAYWTRRANLLAVERILPLFGVQNGEEAKLPRYYLWVHIAQCANPSCNRLFPLRNFIPLEREGGKIKALVFEPTGDDLQPRIIEVQNTESKEKHYVCAFCGQAQTNQIALAEPILAAVVFDQGGKKVFTSVAASDRVLFAPWTDTHFQRLNELLERNFARAISSSLPEQTYAAVRRFGYDTFRDLFSPRQLLVALEYTEAIRNICSEMEAAHIPIEQINALRTYLAFFIGSLVQSNSTLCRWLFAQRAAGTSLDYLTPAFTPSFAESSPIGMAERWLSKTLPAIENLASIPKATEVSLCDASSLPYADEFFDAIVTDPPYFDLVPYADLADFYWVWESAVIADITPATRASDQRPLEIKREQSPELYWQGLEAALRESYRVLKPGRMFAMLLGEKVKESFENYISIAQQVGFELADVKSIPSYEKHLLGVLDQSSTLLVYFRKPSVKTLRSALKAEATVLLDAAESGRPVLYSGLAQLLISELTEEEIADLIPSVAKGARLEILMEVLADKDPRQLLEESLGKVGLRRIAKRLSKSESLDGGRGPLDIVLTHFGFSLPSPAREEGVAQVCDNLRRLCAKIRLAKEKDDVRGPFLNGCTSMERLIRVSMWGWAQMIFDSERDGSLLKILQAANSNKHYQLDRLSFGDILTIFRGLPDLVASSSKVDLIEQKYGRRHIYLPNNKQTKLADRIGEIIALRNKIEHNKDNYWADTELQLLIENTTSTLERGIALLSDLVASHAVPRIARAIQEIRDLFGRITYRLELDDGTETEARFSTQIRLGDTYLYFGSETNPRPVDPLILPLAELGNIH